MNPEDIQKYSGQENQNEKVTKGPSGTEKLTPEQEKIKALQEKLEQIQATEKITKQTAEILYKGLTRDPSIKNDPEAKETIRLFEKYKAEFEKAKQEGKITQEELNKLLETTSQVADSFEYNIGVEYNSETGETKENELNEEKLKTISNREFLAISPENRLQYITKNHIDSESISNGTVNNLEFTFTFDGKFNKELYLKTTAGQVLPKEVREVELSGVSYSRTGLKGEFFTDGGRRLTIHEGTKINNIKVGTNEEIKKLEIEFNKKTEKFLKENPGFDKYKDIIGEAFNRGINEKNIPFILKLFGNNLEHLSDSSRKVKLELIFTDIDIMRGEDYSNIGEELFQLELLKKYYNNDWQKIGKELGISENNIQKFNYSLDIRKKYDKFDKSVNIEALSGNRKRIVSYALRAYENKDILGALHCTDWVDRVYKNSIGKSVYDSNKIFNGVKSINGGTGLGVKEYAPKSIISKIDSGDHLILDKPRGGRYGVGRTHSVIALGKPNNGILKVVSYPNSKIPPRVEYYDLYGLGRAPKNGKPIRIQQAV